MPGQSFSDNGMRSAALRNLPPTASMRTAIAAIWVVSSLICFAMMWRAVGKSDAAYGELERRRQARR